jgi:hypothetical protein
MVEQSNPINQNVEAIKKQIEELDGTSEQDRDAWCKETLKCVLSVYKGSRSKLLLDLITDEIKPAKTFEPEPQPQDTGDLLAELI